MSKSPFDVFRDAMMKDLWPWQEYEKQETKKEKPVAGKIDPESDINISSNFSKHRVIMVVGRSDYNWTATLGPDMAREYARQLIAAADAVDKAKPEQKTVPVWSPEEEVK
jgi:hypothetical protein